MVCLFSVFILPNNKNIIMAATQAAEISDKDVRVIPTNNTYEHTTENHCMLTFPYIRSIFLSTELYNRLPHLSKQE